MARTANRGTMSASSPTSYNVMRWRLGKYIRLSKEDLLRGRDESNSVVNQRRLLEQYHQAHLDEFYEGAEADVYVDDGKTGTDTNREDFQRLLSDISSGRINCVIVKDLSRLSRNYTDAGNLIENLFVRLNVRFISLAEGVDSYRNPDSVSNIIVPITNVMNDQYCYQTSKKIRQVFDMKRRNGEFIGSYAPYGYVKDPGDKHALLIDPEAAEVVKSIFSMFLSGMNKRGITYYLNDHGVLCPTAYKKQQGLKYNAPNAQSNPMWSTITIDTILKNRVYVGAVSYTHLLLGLFQTAEVENLVEFRYHAPDFVGRKTTVLHRVDDIATAGIVAPRLGQHSSQHRIIVHSVIPHFHKWRGAPRSFSCPVIRQHPRRRRSPAKRAAARHCGLGPPRPLYGEGKNFLSYTQDKKGANGDGN